MSRILLGLGSNLGDARARLEEAIRALRDFARIDAVSSVYRTEPVGGVEQPDFLNIACSGDTRLPPGEFLVRILDVENQLGRRREIRNGPRTIDIDILAFGDLVRDSPDPILPHPRMHERAFVLVPLLEIAPEWQHPVTGESVAAMLRDLEGHHRVERIGPLAPGPNGR